MSNGIKVSEGAKIHILSGAWSHDTYMLFLLLKNAKEARYIWVNLFDAGTGHTQNEN